MAVDTPVQLDPERVRMLTERESAAPARTRKRKTA